MSHQDHNLDGDDLEQCRRQLDVILKIDRIRDQATDVKQMLIRVVSVLADTLSVDWCAAGLPDEKSGKVVLKAVNDGINASSCLDQYDIQQALDQALDLSDPSPIATPPSFAANHLNSLFAIPLAIEGEKLGVFVLAAADRAFSPADVDLMRAVAGQTDSAVVHMRTLEMAQERNKQLEAIYQIDRVRDRTSDVQEILGAVSNILISSLGVDLCLLSLIGEESGKSELKTVQDRHQVLSKLDRQAIERAIDWASHQKEAASLASGSPFAQWELDHLLGVSLTVGDHLLGSLVMARSHPAFCKQERALLQAIVSQTDSAIVNAHTARRLEQRTKELETLYHVDRIRDQEHDLGAMLSAVLAELCAVIEAEMGFIMLFDNEGRQLELKASTADDILNTAGHYQIIQDAANAALHTGTLYAQDHLSERIDSIMCVPLILRDKIIGVFGAVNRHGPTGFTNEDKRLLLAITSQVDTAIFESLERRHIREAFQRYVGPNVVEQMLTMTEKDFLKGERAQLSVLFSDMRGFTSWSEHMDPGELVTILNEHLEAMTNIVIAHDGTLDKFVGDEVVAIFGAPLPMPDNAFHAIHTALEMQAAQQQLIARWKARGHALPPIGIGINTGEMIVGNIGCPKQMDYTVIGDAVNLGARLCSAASGGQTLISDATYQIAADRIKADRLPPIKVKGKEKAVQVYQVTGIK
ncbi:MAG: GAF domain-containing protein [Anaerolineae bacterium]|nr:GAF domain-containing protein [Anaerolineae bacterium]